MEQVSVQNINTEFESENMEAVMAPDLENNTTEKFFNTYTKDKDIAHVNGHYLPDEDDDDEDEDDLVLGNEDDLDEDDLEEDEIDVEVEDEVDPEDVTDDDLLLDTDDDLLNDDDEDDDDDDDL